LFTFKPDNAVTRLVPSFGRYVCFASVIAIMSMKQVMEGAMDVMVLSFGFSANFIDDI
jgi:hypothetical protein